VDFRNPIASGAAALASAFGFGAGGR